MSDDLIDIPFPQFDRPLTGTEQQTLANIREDMAPTLRRLFPRTTDSGRSEFDLVARKLQILCKGVEAEIDPKWVAALQNKDVQAMRDIRAATMNAFYWRFREWSTDQMFCLILIQHTQQFLTRFPGLPR